MGRRSVDSPGAGDPGEAARCRWKAAAAGTGREGPRVVWRFEGRVVRVERAPSAAPSPGPGASSRASGCLSYAGSLSPWVTSGQAPSLTWVFVTWGPQAALPPRAPLDCSFIQWVDRRPQPLCAGPRAGLGSLDTAGSKTEHPQITACPGGFPGKPQSQPSEPPWGNCWAPGGERGGCLWGALRC